MNIFVIVPLNKQQKTILESVREKTSESLQFFYCSSDQLTDRLLSEADIIFGNIPTDLLKKTQHLRLLQLNSAGADQYVKSGILPEGTILANAVGAYGLALSEHMLAMLLALIKRLPGYVHQQDAHLWNDLGTVRSIWNSRTLVVGLGDIGSEFAKRMHALGSTVVGIRRTIREIPEYCETVCTFDHLDEELEKADYVACCLPSAPETIHLFTSERFHRMKKDAIFINVGRGTLTDPAVLTEALNSGLIGGACIDVTDPEPLPSDSPLWNAKNLILTPHIAGQYHLPETLNRITAIAAENILAVCSGTEVRNRVL